MDFKLLATGILMIVVAAALSGIYDVSYSKRINSFANFIGILGCICIVLSILVLIWL